jgi:hypothetical protein
LQVVVVVELWGPALPEEVVVAVELFVMRSSRSLLVQPSQSPSEQAERAQQTAALRALGRSRQEVERREVLREAPKVEMHLPMAAAAAVAAASAAVAAAEVER